MDAHTDARTRVLACLKAAGEKGLTTWDLINATHHSRCAGRVWELRQQYDIEHIQESKSTHRWIYRGVKQAPTLLQMMEGAA